MVCGSFKLALSAAWMDARDGRGQGARDTTTRAHDDVDTINESFRFIRDDEDDAENNTQTVRMARHYYDQLHKEFVICDLSRYKLGQLGLRWRVESEVASGKGEKCCGSVGCTERERITPFEINFVYQETGETKQALVKLVLCPECAYKLHHQKVNELKMKAAKAQRHANDRARSRRRDESPGSNHHGSSDEDRKSKRNRSRSRRKLNSS